MCWYMTTKSMLVFCKDSVGKMHASPWLTKYVYGYICPLEGQFLDFILSSTNHPFDLNWIVYGVINHCESIGHPFDILIFVANSYRRHLTMTLANCTLCILYCIISYTYYIGMKCVVLN